MNRKSDGSRTSQLRPTEAALKSKKPATVVKAFQQLDANPDTSRKDYLLQTAIQDVKIEGISTGVPLGCDSEERMNAYQRIYQLQLRRELGLPSDTSDIAVAKAMNEEINLAMRELKKHEQHTVLRRERQFLGLSETVSEKELTEARKQPSGNERRRLGLSEDATGSQLEESIIRVREEAVRIYLGLAKDVSESEVLRAAQEEKALDEDTPAEDSRLLLGLSSICADEALDEAMEKAAQARMQRFQATNQRQLMELRIAAAQHARRHALGLPNDASEANIAAADSEAVYTMRRRNLCLPEDAPAWTLEQASKKRLRNQPLTVSASIR
jgi:hypothetical protein